MTGIVYLDPEVLKEGQSADEPATNWKTGSGPAPIVDMSKILGNHKHFGKYFAPHVFLPFPAWIYHASEPEFIVKTAKEAREFGVWYDTDDARYVCEGEWKARPVVKKKPSPIGSGKNLISSERAQGGASLEIMSQILQQMQKGQAAPPALTEAVKADPDYAAFLEFKKWKAGATAVETPADVAASLSASEEKEILIKLAGERDIHVDKRWGLEKIKSALDEAGEG